MSKVNSLGLSIFGKAITVWELKEPIHSKEPKLIIEKIYVRDFIFANSKELRRFVIATVRNVGESLAKRCWGYFESDQTSLYRHKLHWADTPYAPLRDSVELIDLGPNETRDLDIVFSLGGLGTKLENGFFTSSPIIVTGSNPDLRGTADPSAYQVKYVTNEPLEGSWIATPISLLHCQEVPQTFLIPAGYKGIVGVETDKANQGDQKEIEIISTYRWTNLNVRVIR